MVEHPRLDLAPGRWAISGQTIHIELPIAVTHLSGQGKNDTWSRNICGTI
jgi:hypothetical protein